MLCERRFAFAVTAKRLGLALLLWSLVVPQSALGVPHRFGLVFRDARTIKLDWDAATAGRAAEFCNVDRVAARPISGRALDFDFKRGTKVLDDKQEREVVTVTLGAKGPLAPGHCRTVTLRTSGTVKPGTYTGVLSVISGRVGHAHRAVTITVPEPKPKKVAAVGFAGPVTMEANRSAFGRPAEFTGNGHLLLRAALKDQTLKVPQDCPSKESEQEDEQCPFVGNLHNGSDYALVYVDGKFDPSASDEQPPRLPAELPIRLENASKIGDYTGSLDLANTPEDAKDDVKLTATVTDPIGYAIVAYLAGVVISLFSQYVLRRFFPKHRLRERWRAFESGYAAAKEAFDARTPELAGFDVPTDSRKTYTDSIDEAIKQYGRRVVWFEEESEAAKQIDASLDGVDADIAAWRDEDGLHASLTKLNTQLESIAQFLNTQFPLQTAPAIRAAGAALLKPRPLEVGEATTTVAAADVQTALLTEWLDLAKLAKRYAAWIQLLSGMASEAEKDVLRLATLKLGEAVQELLDAEDAADMKRLRVAKDLRAVHDRLAPLGVAHDAWLPPENDEPVDLTSVLASLGLGGAAVVQPLDVNVATMVQHNVGAWIAGSIGAAIGATPVVLRTSWRIFLGILVIALTVIIAAVAGLISFYNPPWGTWEDYLTVVLVGTAAQAFIQAIVETVQKLLPPLPDQILTGPAAATVPAATATPP